MPTKTSRSAARRRRRLAPGSSARSAAPVGRRPRSDLTARRLRRRRQGVSPLSLLIQPSLRRRRRRLLPPVGGQQGSTTDPPPPPVSHPPTHPSARAPPPPASSNGRPTSPQPPSRRSRSADRRPLCRSGLRSRARGAQGPRACGGHRSAAAAAAAGEARESSLRARRCASGRVPVLPRRVISGEREPSSWNPLCSVLFLNPLVACPAARPSLPVRGAPSAPPPFSFRPPPGQHSHATLFPSRRSPRLLPSIATDAEAGIPFPLQPSTVVLGLVELAEIDVGFAHCSPGAVVGARGGQTTRSAAGSKGERARNGRTSPDRKRKLEVGVDDGAILVEDALDVFLRKAAVLCRSGRDGGEGGFQLIKKREGVDGESTADSRHTSSWRSMMSLTARSIGPLLG